jgi:hypothetical protein
MPLVQNSTYKPPAWIRGGQLQMIYPLLEGMLLCEDCFNRPRNPSNPDPDRLAEKPPPNEILARRFGKLGSRQMKNTVKSPELAVYRHGLGDSFCRNNAQ